MRYRLQHALSRDVAGADFFEEVNVSDALIIPRIGDTVHVQGLDYQVVSVWHDVIVTGIAKAEAGDPPTVRVK